jgi:cysteine desulfurase
VNRVYLDHAATTPLAPSVLDAMLPFLQSAYGNPSSVHELGRRARAAVDAAREQISASLHCRHREILFTGSGTEADNLALRGVLEHRGAAAGRHIVVSAIEHDAVLNTAQTLAENGAAQVTVVPCDTTGRVDPAAVADAVRGDTALVSVMLVNNETAMVQDVAAIAETVRSKNPRTLVHTDAVQGFARFDVHPAELDVDLMTLSAHKIGGPKGVGALWVRDGVTVGAQLTGGGQERGRRSGTENVAGIAGFGAAAERLAAMRRRRDRQDRVLTSRLRDRLVPAIPRARVPGDDRHRAAGILPLVIPGARTDVLLAALDQRGVAASGGSACASGAPTPSHVLLAMGIEPELAVCALRLSLGETTTEAEVDIAAEVIAATVAGVRGSVRLRATASA